MKNMMDKYNFKTAFGCALLDEITITLHTDIKATIKFTYDIIGDVFDINARMLCSCSDTLSIYEVKRRIFLQEMIRCYTPTDNIRHIQQGMLDELLQTCYKRKEDKNA